ncbi:hypothetical protein MRB53_035308 [Persea americana]|uniref:Uncharacterized protein n=1 Tax=Persea americana TaxID=3435 RepID=A0ACC2K4F3_PERAE|nr:hypothetical protein MRB53_035308 [Persea americana]
MDVVDGDWKTSPRMFDQDYPKENREKSKRANALSRLGLGDGFIDDCISHRPLARGFVGVDLHEISGKLLKDLYFITFSFGFSMVLSRTWE